MSLTTSAFSAGSFIAAPPYLTTTTLPRNRWMYGSDSESSATRASAERASPAGSTPVSDPAAAGSPDTAGADVPRPLRRAPAGRPPGAQAVAVAQGRPHAAWAGRAHPARALRLAIRMRRASPIDEDLCPRGLATPRASDRRQWVLGGGGK